MHITRSPCREWLRTSIRVDGGASHRRGVEPRVVRLMGLPRCHNVRSVARRYGHPRVADSSRRSGHGSFREAHVMECWAAGPAIVGQLGPGGNARVREMAARLGDLPEVFAARDILVHARGGLRHEPQRVVWGHQPTAPAPNGSASSAFADGVVVERRSGVTAVRGSASGALPLYVDTSTEEAVFSSHLDVLLKTRSRRPEPDWNGVLQMVAASGPLGGRTT